MTLLELNAADRDAAEALLRRCCGSARWAREMAARRPFADVGALTQEADRIWCNLDAADWLEAFAAHPRIGETNMAGGAGQAGRRGAEDWSAREQAGMDAAPNAIRRRLAVANREYEQRFGFIYIVCATGKSAGDMLDLAERRLGHTRDEELAVAAEEQRKITRLRLGRLLTVQL